MFILRAAKTLKSIEIHMSRILILFNRGIKLESDCNIKMLKVLFTENIPKISKLKLGQIHENQHQKEIKAF